MKKPNKALRTKKLELELLLKSLRRETEERKAAHAAKKEEKRQTARRLFNFFIQVGEKPSEELIKKSLAEGETYLEACTSVENVPTAFLWGLPEDVSKCIYADGVISEVGREFVPAIISDEDWWDSRNAFLIASTALSHIEQFNWVYLITDQIKQVPTEQVERVLTYYKVHASSERWDKFINRIRSYYTQSNLGRHLPDLWRTMWVNFAVNDRHMVRLEMFKVENWPHLTPWWNPKAETMKWRADPHFTKTWEVSSSKYEEPGLLGYVVQPIIRFFKDLFSKRKEA